MSNPSKIKLLKYFLRKFPRAIEAIARVAEAGDIKHNGTVRSFLAVNNGYQEYSESMVRHLLDEIVEGPVDLEGGGLHAAKIAWGALSRLEIQLEGTQGEVVDYQHMGGPIGKPRKSIYEETSVLEDLLPSPELEKYQKEYKNG